MEEDAKFQERRAENGGRVGKSIIISTPGKRIRLAVPVLLWGRVYTTYVDAAETVRLRRAGGITLAYLTPPLQQLWRENGQFLTYAPPPIVCQILLEAKDLFYPLADPNP